MNVDRWLTAVSSIATFCGTVIILFTLFEMGEQRKSTYKPDLVFGGDIVSHIYVNESIGNPAIWSFTSPSEIKSKQLKPIEEDPQLNLYNIGMGAAKTITAKWKFDIEGSINKVKELDLEKRWAFDYIYHNTILHINDRLHKGSSVHNVQLQLSQSIDYILPVNVQTQPHRLPLPGVYLSLKLLTYPLLLQQASKRGWKQVSEVLSLPADLRLTLNYFDIGNNVHDKEFAIEVQLTSIAGKQLPMVFTNAEASITAKQVN